MIWNLIGSIGGMIFDPNAITETGFISCFAEPLDAVGFLTCKRLNTGQGQYWKTHYNNPLSKDTVTRYI